MDDQTKAKGLMAAGLATLAVIGVVVVLVVLPTAKGSHGSPTAVAQGGSPMSPAPPPGGPAGGGAPSAPMGPAAPGAAGMPAMPGGPTGAPTGPGAMPTGAAPGGPPTAGEKPVMEPLEESRDNPFAPFGGVGLAAEAVRMELAFAPAPKSFPIGTSDQHLFPSRGPNGETIQVPSAAPSRRPGGPKAPPPDEWMRVAAIMRDAEGRAMVVLQGTGGQGQVLQVGDTYRGWRVEQIMRDRMILTKEEEGEVVRKTVHLRVGGARGERAPGGAPGPRRPGVAVPGAGEGGAPAPPAGGQPGVRRPGGGQPGAFPGVGGGQGRAQPQPPQ